MGNISTLNNKATVCAGKICATVEGEAAKIINIVVVGLALISLGVAIHKLMK
jgi:hypothetical protein